METDIKKEAHVLGVALVDSYDKWLVMVGQKQWSKDDFDMIRSKLVTALSAIQKLRRAAK